MHAKPDLRVILEWMIAGSGSVIADVIRTLLAEIDAIWFNQLRLLLLGLHAVVLTVLCWLLGFVSFPRASIAPLLLPARMLLGDVTEEGGVRADCRRWQAFGEMVRWLRINESCLSG